MATPEGLAAAWVVEHLCQVFGTSMPKISGLLPEAPEDSLFSLHIAAENARATLKNRRASAEDVKKSLDALKTVKKELLEAINDLPPGSTLLKALDSEAPAAENGTKPAAQELQELVDWAASVREQTALQALFDLVQERRLGGPGKSADQSQPGEAEPAPVQILDKEDYPAHKDAVRGAAQQNGGRVAPEKAKHQERNKVDSEDERALAGPLPGGPTLRKRKQVEYVFEPSVDGEKATGKGKENVDRNVRSVKSKGEPSPAKGREEGAKKTGEEVTGQSAKPLLKNDGKMDAKSEKAKHGAVATRTMAEQDATTKVPVGSGTTCDACGGGSARGFLISCLGGCGKVFHISCKGLSQTSNDLTTQRCKDCILRIHAAALEALAETEDKPSSRRAGAGRSRAQAESDELGDEAEEEEAAVGEEDEADEEDVEYTGVESRPRHRSRGVTQDGSLKPAKRGRAAEEDEIENDSAAEEPKPAADAPRQPLKQRKQKLRFSVLEDETLRKGMKLYSSQSDKWKRILSWGRGKFHESRDPISLKDRWRNLQRYL